MTDTTNPTIPPASSDWRVPQQFTPATSYEIRDRLQDYLIRDLVGPWDGPTETLDPALTRGIPTDPTNRYLAGYLGPRKGAPDTEGDPLDVDLDLGATVTQDPDLADQLNPRSLGNLWISSMGLTFRLAADDPAAAGTGPARIVVTVDAGRYAPGAGAGAGEPTADGSAARAVAREPLRWAVELDPDAGDQRIGLIPPTVAADGTAVPATATTAPSPGGGIVLDCRVRLQPDGVLVVRVTLINQQPGEANPRYAPYLFQASLSVTALDGHRDVFEPIGVDAADPDRDPHPDAEEARLDLLYRDRPVYVTGHNVAGCHERRDGELRAWRLRTEWAPAVDVPAVTAEPIEGLTTSMARLADLAEADDPAGLITALRPLIDRYADWLDRQAGTAEGFAPAWRDVADTALAAADDIVTRLRAALDLLADDRVVRQAFAFANRAMVLQRHRSVVAGLREREPGLGAAAVLARVTDGDQAVKNAKWRPFQLGFVLLNLGAVADPDSPERRGLVDLLFFPTGGGKTEAYLGLAAYAFAVRRLQGVVGTGPDARDGSAGVTVLMRYTLRLLTAQQFQRAATLVCAAETLRRADPGTWGSERFSIGLWVGMSVSPNWYHDAATSIAQARESGRRGAKVPVLQTTRCPWCGEPLRAERDLHADDVTRRVLLFCPRGEDSDAGGQACPFSRRLSPTGLPIMTVDEEVYREPPSLLIATVDKLAQLPWYGFAGALFGRVAQRCPRHGYRHPDLDRRTGCANRHAATSREPATLSVPVTRLRPPDLVIQDELHLISGALGSTVGLFETAVEELTGWTTPAGMRCTPKIIASTATTKRAAQQVRGLFARDLAIFPPQVLNAASTFFSTEQPLSAEHPGRRYVGLCPHGSRLKSAEIRLAEILLLAGQTLLDAHGEPADPYATIVAYFSSTRELAGMRRYLEDDIVSRVFRTPYRTGLVRRAGQREVMITELTSRISSAYITDALRQLAVPFNAETRTSVRSAAIAGAFKALDGKRPADLVDARPTDVALATSMLQVGVDIGRLGLMMITGQPKNVAEYIQASSRVGRESEKPGLVITLFNWTRPRDLAYYESFEHTHATLYRRVEALSVTPFARRCLDRGTAGTLVAAIRNRADDWSLATAAQDVPLDSPEVTALIDRALDRAQRAGDLGARQYLDEKIAVVYDRWQEAQDWPGAPIGYTRTVRTGVTYAPLIRRAGEGPWTDTTVARSMRETENEINLLLPPAPQIFAPVHDAPHWAARPADVADVADDADAEGPDADRGDRE